MSFIATETEDTKLDFGKPVPYGIVKPFFTEDFAEDICRDFPAPDRLNVKGEGVALSETIIGDFPSTIQQLFEYVHSDAYATLIRHVSGFRIAPSRTQISLYLWAKGGRKPHVDKRRGSWGETRPLTHLIYLTKDLLPEDGGDFVLSQNSDLSNPILSHHPEFNSGLFFVRTPDSWHAVTPMNSSKAHLRKTISIVVQGWDALSPLYLAKNAGLSCSRRLKGLRQGR